MLASAEIRWFWRNAPPPGLEDWFRKPGSDYAAAGGGQSRRDQYLRDASQVEVGIKRRGENTGVEVKGKLAVISPGIAVGPFVGPIERWAKWTSAALVLPSSATIMTEKRRWLRKFDASPPVREIALGADEQPLAEATLPVRGCNVELTRVELPSGTVWWTLGFEAFGTQPFLEEDLGAAAAVLAARNPPSLAGGQLASYPAWLSSHIL